MALGKEGSTVDLQILRKFLDACHQAKRITELMPALPGGMTPRHIHVIDALYQLQCQGNGVKVSDVSSYLGVTRPSITKAINELEDLGGLVKLPDEADRRVVRLELTDTGLRWYRYYVEQYQSWLAGKLEGIEEQQFLTTVEVLSRVWKIMTESGEVPPIPEEREDQEHGN